jgi:hypothetical protein
LNEEAVRKGAQTDLDELGIAKNAREEKLKARQQKDHGGEGAGPTSDPGYHEEMAKLYRQHVMREQPTLQIQGLGGRRQAGSPSPEAPKSADVQPVLHKDVV